MAWGQGAATPEAAWNLGFPTYPQPANTPGVPNQYWFELDTASNGTSWDTGINANHGSQKILFNTKIGGILPTTPANNSQQIFDGYVSQQFSFTGFIKNVSFFPGSVGSEEWYIIKIPST